MQSSYPTRTSAQPMERSTFVKLPSKKALEPTSRAIFFQQSIEEDSPARGLAGCAGLLPELQRPSKHNLISKKSYIRVSTLQFFFSSVKFFARSALAMLYTLKLCLFFGVLLRAMSSVLRSRNFVGRLRFRHRLQVVKVP